MFIIIVATYSTVFLPSSLALKTTTSGTTSSELDWLHTSGNLIETSNGTVFEFKGAAISVTNWGWSNPNLYTNGNWNEGLFAALKADGGNSVRLTLTYYQYNPTYSALIDQVVNWCTSNGLYVILDLHEGDPSSTTSAQDLLKIMQNPNATLSTLLTPAPGDALYPDISWIGLLQFWAGRYANDSDVSMINILNEPAQSQSNGRYLFNLWYNDAELAVNAIAAVNPNILVGVYGMDWGNSLVDFYSKPLPETNVVYDAEGAYMAYQVGYNSYADQYIGGNYTLGKTMYIAYLNENDIIPMSQKYPVIIMEWGSEQWKDYNATLDPAYIRWMSDALQIFSQNSLGSEYWSWDISGIGSDLNGTNLGSVNQGLLDYSSWMNHTFVLDARGELWQQYAAGSVTTTSTSTEMSSSSSSSTNSLTSTSETRITTATSAPAPMASTTVYTSPSSTLSAITTVTTTAKTHILTSTTTSLVTIIETSSSPISTTTNQTETVTSTLDSSSNSPKLTSLNSSDSSTYTISYLTSTQPTTTSQTIMTRSVELTNSSTSEVKITSSDISKNPISPQLITQDSTTSLTGILYGMLTALGVFVIGIKPMKLFSKRGERTRKSNHGWRW